MNAERFAEAYAPHIDTLSFPAQLAVGRYLEAMKQHLVQRLMWPPRLVAHKEHG